MRMSRLFGTTLREAPAGAHSASHELLVRAGFIRPAGAGRFACLPLAMRSVARIESMARGILEQAGGQRVSLPVAPGQTVEEAMTLLCGTEVRSWRQLPRLLFQLLSGGSPTETAAGPLSTGTVSLTSVSIDAEEDGQGRRYRALTEAFRGFFSACGIPVETVESASAGEAHSDAGAIVSLSVAGPDVVVRCPTCGYQAERDAARFQRAADSAEELRPIQKVATPGCPTIGELAAFLRVDTSRTAKAVLLMAAAHRQERERFIFAVVRGDREVSERKLACAVGSDRLRPATEDEIRLAGAVPGYASPVGLPSSTLVIVDEEVAASTNLVSGANEEGYHLLHTNVPRDYRPSVIGDIARAAEGDRCHSCGATLGFHAGVKLGSMWKSGNGSGGTERATFQDRDGTERPLFFGWHEIALDRLLAVIAEEHHDDHGLVWPVGVGPFDVHLVSLGTAGSAAAGAAERLHEELENAGRSVLFDDRDERPGVKFADADLIGVPVRLTVSERSLQAGGVEMRLRNQEGKEMIPHAEVIARVSERPRF